MRPHTHSPKASIAFVIALLAAAAAPAPLMAQVIKPRFVLAVDTSGSMLWTPRLVVSNQVAADGNNNPYVCGASTSCSGGNPCPGGFDCINGRCDCPVGHICGMLVGKPNPHCYLAEGAPVHGDGTLLHPGCDIDADGFYNDSRVYQAKAALTDVISGFGEIEFALSRFEQNETNYCNSSRCNGTDYRECTQQNYCSATICPSCNSGDCADCTNFAFDQTCHGSTSPFGPGMVTCGTIVQSGSDGNNCIGYQSTANASNGTCNGEVLVPFPTGSDNYNELLNWMNGAEAGSDKELRANGATPLAGMLRTVKADAVDPAMAGDAQRSCRTYGVILLTDGVETCQNLTAATNAAAALNAAGASVYVIGLALCPGSVPRANCAAIRQLDAIASAGGTTEALIANSQAEISARIADILQRSFKIEKCNCIDDNCNNLVDETFPDRGSNCSVGVGECRRDGKVVCDPTDSTRQRTVCCVDSGNLCPASGCPLMPGTPRPEICDGKDNDCNGLVDDGIPGGCICVPSPEVCDGRDNNCNGLTDEPPVPGAGEPCGSSTGECRPGSLVCTGGRLTCTGGRGPAAEVCNGKDDNCNGAVDETDPNVGRRCYPPMTAGCDLGTGMCKGLCRFGTDVCEAGMIRCKYHQGPVAEKCNGLDDDCDGVVDNGFDVGGPCDNGKMGTCRRTGQWVCAAGGGRTCTAPGGNGSPETCNGLDDDCNGAIDDGGPLPGEGLPCGVGIGECMNGKTVCEGGKIVCKGGKGPGMEICNGKDDNCNGIVDENVPGEGTDCVCPGLDPAKVGIGECRAGKIRCRGDRGLVCEGCVFPTEEICDGKDNDCDGVPDTMAPCPAGLGCRGGECAPQCRPGEFPCPAGQRCVMGYCVPEPCADVDCGGRACREGRCIDPCENHMCTGPGQTCREGNCVDCYTDGCPQANQRCMAGVCKTDPCLGRTCLLSEFCSNGACVPTCDAVTCPTGERCVAGKCLGDACVGVACAENEFCDPSTGVCRFNPCKVIQCLTGTRCVLKTGKCEADPCDLVVCSRDCQYCDVTAEGVADCVGPPSCRPPPATKLAGAGGGGCTTCAVGAVDPAADARGLAWLLAVALGLLVRRRR